MKFQMAFGLSNFLPAKVNGILVVLLHCFPFLPRATNSFSLWVPAKALGSSRPVFFPTQQVSGYGRMAFCYVFKISWWVSILPVPLCSFVTQGTLVTTYLNRPKTCPLKVHAGCSADSLSLSETWKLIIILWWLCPRQPPADTSPTSPPLFSRNRSSELPSLVGSLTSCVRISSFPHSRNLLDPFFSVGLKFLQIPGKLKSHHGNKDYW